MTVDLEWLNAQPGWTQGNEAEMLDAINAKLARLEADRATLVEALRTHLPCCDCPCDDCHACTQARAALEKVGVK